jgi:L-ascorbate metabolism protein UlaG (beta-lactamase superfamily)
MIKFPFCRLTIFSALFCVTVSCSAFAEVKVQWFGHATTKIETSDGRVIVIDPFFSSNPKAPTAFRDPASVGDVDLILVTHGHIDHAADLVPLAQRTGAQVIGPYEMIRNLISLGALEGQQVVLVGKGGYVEPLGRGLKVHMVPAEHSSSIDANIAGLSELQRKTLDALRHYSGGEAVGYVIEFEDGFTLYHTGDTGLFGDMSLIGDFFEPDLILVCIGGVFTMGPEEAAYAVNQLIKPGVAVPIHYGTYPAINRTPEEFIEALGDTDTEVVVMEPGEIRSFP